MKQRLHTAARHWPGVLSCAIGGALIPFSFAPFNLWPCALAGVAVFYFCLQQRNLKQTFLLGWVFGTALFASGASWVYVSIHDHGHAPVALAVLLTTIFVIGLGLVFALPFYIWRRCCRHRQHTAWMIAFPAVWVLGEWLRSWLLTGFPWLYLGYAHVDTVLAGWFPIVGVWGVSFIVVLSAVALTELLTARRIWPSVPVLALCIAGIGLNSFYWTTGHRDKPLTVTIVQPNFSLAEKWNPDNRDMIRATLNQMSRDYWHSDIILWPEAALPEFFHNARPFLGKLDHKGQQHNTSLITGIPWRTEQGLYHNSIVALGDGEGVYHKVRLVPFGEYVPLEKLLRGLIAFFDLPMSSFSPGPDRQTMPKAGNHRFAPYICYEIVYPHLVARNATETDFLVTISNDSWFGTSSGPLQHLQMAQARAMETGRYLIRGTNNGVSAIIKPDGTIQSASAQFERTVLTGKFYPFRGTTPFMRLQSWPLFGLCLLLLLWAWHDTRQTGK